MWSQSQQHPSIRKSSLPARLTMPSFLRAVSAGALRLARPQVQVFSVDALPPAWVLSWLSRIEVFGLALSDNISYSASGRGSTTDDLELLGDIFVDASPDEFIGRLTQVLRHVGDYCREGNSLRNFPRWQPAMLRSVRCEPALAADEACHVEPKHLRKIMFREEE